MREQLASATETAARADAILYAIDETFMDETEERLQLAILTVWDLVKKLHDELDQLSIDAKMGETKNESAS